MDPKFADRMSDLGQITEEVLKQRWATLTEVAGNADHSQQARIVLIACGGGLDRDRDSWFWGPFREHEITIPVDDGGELFMRLAECAARYMIEQEDWVLPAMFVRLAEMSGLSSFSQDLVDVASERLKESPSAPPPFTSPAQFWGNAGVKALEESPDNVSVLSDRFTKMASGAQKAMTGLGNHVAALTRWAADLAQRLDHEQRLVQWLLNGVRHDARAWSDLEPGTAAVDAACELAQFVLQAPQTRHEATLGQVLAVAEKETGTVEGAVRDLSATFSVPDDPALTDLVPLSVALAGAGALPQLTPIDLAVRVLWETTTIRLWEA